METWEIRPGEGIGPIRLGMTRAEVRAAMGEDGERWRSDDELMFDAARVRADFDGDERVEFVEAMDDAPVRLSGLDLFALDRDDLATKVAELLGVPGEWREQGETLLFESPGLVCWGTSQKTETEREFATVGVFGPGYYDG